MDWDQVRTEDLPAAIAAAELFQTQEGKETGKTMGKGIEKAKHHITRAFLESHARNSQKKSTPKKTLAGEAEAFLETLNASPDTVVEEPKPAQPLRPLAELSMNILAQCTTVPVIRREHKGAWVVSDPGVPADVLCQLALRSLGFAPPPEPMTCSRSFMEGKPKAKKPWYKK